MAHKMKLAEKPFKAIQSDLKTFELRLYDSKRQMIKENDEIVFSLMDNPSETIKTKVLKIHRFKSFKDIYESLPLEKCGYRKDELYVASPDDMLKFYSKEAEKQYGVVAFEIEVIPE